MIDPAKLETYGIPNSAIIQTVTSNNRLIPAARLIPDREFSVKVPGLIENANDLFDLHSPRAPMVC